MMTTNHTTKQQREQRIARAAELIEMDDTTRVTNFEAARVQLMSEFGISSNSALTALVHAAMRERYKIHSAAAELGKLGGAVTSERKAAASRANGRRGGRPRKEQS